MPRLECYNEKDRWEEGRLSSNGGWDPTPPLLTLMLWAHLTHLSSLCGRAVGPHGQPFAFTVTIPVPVPVPVPGHRGTCVGRGGWRVQRLGAKQRPRSMELTEVTESNQSVHLKGRQRVCGAKCQR